MFLHQCLDSTQVTGHQTTTYRRALAPEQERDGALRPKPTLPFALELSPSVFQGPSHLGYKMGINKVLYFLNIVQL